MIYATFDHLHRYLGISANLDTVIRFITSHSGVSEEEFRHLLLRTDEIATDVGSVVYGREAVDVGLVDQLGSVGDALAYLHGEIDRRRQEQEESDN